MKSPLGKLRRFALQKNDAKEKREFLAPAHLDELALAAKVLPLTALSSSTILWEKNLGTVIYYEFRICHGIKLFR